MVRLARFFRSLSVKLIAICLVLAAVPVLTYGFLETADSQKSQLLLRSIQREGGLIAASLFPRLENFSPDVAETLHQVLSDLAAASSTIKLFFRPIDRADGSGFLFVASYPGVSEQSIDAERAEIVRTGLLERITDACDRSGPLAMQFRSASGQAELLTYLGTRKTAAGCWALIASIAPADMLGPNADRPYWQTPQMQVAAVIYLTMALLIVSIFVVLRRNLRLFEMAVAEIRRGDGDGASFGSRNKIPELSRVAGEFDDLVSALRRSERLIRQAAMENAHAFKTPLAVISQSVEPLRRELGGGRGRAGRSIDRIEKSIERLDGLISAARRMDESTAVLIEQPVGRLELLPFVTSLLREHAPAGADRGIALQHDIPDDLFVLAQDELLRTAIENVLTNAMDFAPENSAVTVIARDGNGETVTVSIIDRGVGVPEVDLDRIFDRYYSTRRSDGYYGNFGIGLWIVRRNMEAMGGQVTAANHPSGGLVVDLVLRRAPA
ncbi:MAG: HAMP domain-containing sensor histidine kinase [Sneathiellaceae bacterium]